MKMNLNISIAGRIIRVIIAASIITLYATNAISGVLGVVLIELSVIFVLTSLMSSSHHTNPLD